MTALTHLDEAGAAHMVDVSGKLVTAREAIASGRITMSPTALAAIRDGAAAKGDVLAVARVAGIMAAKRTGDLIPLCHPLPLTRVSVDLRLDETGVVATATAATEGRTGVEMEAMCAASVALLTIYDMAKAVDRAMTIGEVRLLAKRGGKSAEWRRDEDTAPPLAAEPQLFTTDLPRALAFYTGPLGFRAAFVHGEPPFYAQVVSGAARLNLRHVDAMPIDRAAAERDDLLAATLTVADATALHREWQSAGVAALTPPRDEPWGTRTFMLRDPDGNLLLVAGER